MHVLLFENQLVSITDDSLQECIDVQCDKLEITENQLEIFEFPETCLMQELNIAIRPKIFLQRLQQYAEKDILSELSKENQFRLREVCGILGLSEYRIIESYGQDEVFSKLIEEFKEWMGMVTSALTLICDETSEDMFKSIQSGLHGWLSQIENIKQQNNIEE